MMGEKPDWVQNVGDAFLESPEAVMDSVQRLRNQANAAGNLKSNEQQTVIVEAAPQAPQQTIVKIEPANPQVVYVPTYNPTVVYGPWPYPSYPPYYWPTPGYAFGSALMTGIAFGTGIAITNALWGGCNWGRGDVNVNVNKYNSINSNRQINANQTNWQHNSANRGGVPYRDQATRAKYDKPVGGADQRQDYRGKDANRDASRERAQATLADRGADPAKGREQLQKDPATRDRAQSAADQSARDRAQGADRSRAQTADRDASRQSAQSRDRDNALRGAGDAQQTRQQADRGASSRQSMDRASAGGGAAARPTASGGGGGARASGGGGAGGARAAGGGGGARAGGGGRGR